MSSTTVEQSINEFIASSTPIGLAAVKGLYSGAITVLAAWYPYMIGLMVIFFLAYKAIGWLRH